MTKIYEGGDTYHLHSVSGKVLDVTTDEINEIAEESPIARDLREEVAEAKNEYNRARGYANDACGEIDELESYLMSEREDVDLDEILRLVQGIKGTVERI